MAALETIRKKAVLLTVVIGLALLAFILGDLLNSGQAFFGDGTTIVKVGDEKIDAVEFQKRYEEVSAQYQNSGAQMPDGALIQNNVIEGMITEKLLNKELEAVGVFVTDLELTEAMTGATANPMMVQYAQQMGFESPAQMYDVLFNPAKYGFTADQVAEAKANWLRLEKDMEMITNKMLKNERLKRLLYYTTNNALDREPIGKDASLELFGKNIKIIPKLCIDKEVLNYIIITFDDFTSNMTNPEYRDNVINFIVICHYD